MKELSEGLKAVAGEDISIVHLTVLKLALTAA